MHLLGTEKMENVYSVSDFIALANQTFEYAYPSVHIEGEIANFKVNQGKYVFFDLKDASGSVNCFMTVWQLRMPLEDGMKVVIVASPKLTPWGKFSLTVKTVAPKGEGTIKKAFELLKKKLDEEGVFALERKRPLPRMPQYVGVISSTQAAGYGDFMKIANDRWGGVQFDVAHVQVQGAVAADQIIAAIEYFNARDTLPEVLVIVRGGGSADDLAVFNDEKLVREIARSRIPTLVGVGHEVDVTLAELAADVRAATPSNAAQLLVPDKEEMRRLARHKMQSVVPKIDTAVRWYETTLGTSLRSMLERIERRHGETHSQLAQKRHLLEELNPQKALERGYALLRGDVRQGATISIETMTQIIEAEVQHVTKK